MTLSKGEGNIPSSPGRLVLIDEKSSVESDVHDISGTNPSRTIKPVSRTCRCKICVRSPDLIASQTLVQDVMGAHKVDPTSR